MNSYIGVLINDSSVFDITDPFINPIICQQLSIPRENQTILKVRNALPGIYHAWHILSNSHEVKELLILHNSYDFKDLEDYSPLCVGVVCTYLSRKVCVVDERYHFDPTFSYYKLEKEAYYDGKEILKRLPESPYPAHIRTALANLITRLLNDGKHPQGHDIYEIIKDYNVWDVFCSNKIYSSHWSVDVCNRLDGNIPAAVFKGGAVSLSEPGFLTCYCYRNNRAKAFAIRIPLEMSDDLYKEDDNEKVIAFPKRTDNVSDTMFS